MKYKTKIMIVEWSARIIRIMWAAAGLLGLVSSMFIDNRVVAIICTCVGAIMCGTVVEIILVNIPDKH